MQINNGSSASLPLASVTDSVTFMLIFSHLIGMVKMLYSFTLIGLSCACKSKMSTSIKLQDIFTCITEIPKNNNQVGYLTKICTISGIKAWSSQNLMIPWQDGALKIIRTSEEIFCYVEKSPQCLQNIFEVENHACDLAKVGKYIMLAHELFILYLCPFVLLGAFESSNTSQCS